MLLPRFTPKNRKIGNTVSSFQIFHFELLDPEILSAASSVLRPIKFLHSSAKKSAYRVVVRIVRNMFFRAAGS